MKKVASILLICAIALLMLGPIALVPTDAGAVDWCDYCSYGCGPCCAMCMVILWWDRLNGDGWWEF